MLVRQQRIEESRRIKQEKDLFTKENNKRLPETILIKKGNGVYPVKAPATEVNTENN